MRKIFFATAGLLSISIFPVSCASPNNNIHHYEEITYTWNEDNSECVASRKCIDDDSLNVSETRKSIFSLVTEPSSSSSGLGRYAVTFTNEIFEAQQKEVSIPYLGQYEVDELIYRYECDESFVSNRVHALNYTLTTVWTDNNIFTETITHKFDNGKICRNYQYVIHTDLYYYEETLYFEVNEKSYNHNENTWEFTIHYYDENEGKYLTKISSENFWDYIAFPNYAEHFDFPSYTYYESYHMYQRQTGSYITEDQVEWNYWNISYYFEENKLVSAEDHHESSDSSIPNWTVHSTYTFSNRGNTEVILP